MTTDKAIEIIGLYDVAPCGPTPEEIKEAVAMAIKALKDVSTKPVLEEVTFRHRGTGCTEKLLMDKKRMQVYLTRCTAELYNALGWYLEENSDDEERSS